MPPLALSPGRTLGGGVTGGFRGSRRGLPGAQGPTPPCVSCSSTPARCAPRGRGRGPATGRPGLTCGLAMPPREPGKCHLSCLSPLRNEVLLERSLLPRPCCPALLAERTHRRARLGKTCSPAPYRDAGCERALPGASHRGRAASRCCSAASAWPASIRLLQEPCQFSAEL